MKRKYAAVMAALLCLIAITASLPQAALVTAALAESGDTSTGDPTTAPTATPMPRRGSAENPYRVNFAKHTNMDITYLRHIYNNMIAHAGTPGYPLREGTQYFKDATTGASFVAVWTDYGGVTITQL